MFPWRGTNARCLQDPGQASGPALLASLEFSEHWDAAEMGPVVKYLESNKHFSIPQPYLDAANFGLKEPES